jgi:uncharacterized protein (UPF0332 family)
MEEQEQPRLDKQLAMMLNKASRALASAKRQLKAGDYDFASSRAYYAVFYAMEAVLLTKDLSFSKHSGVISAFNRHFVKPSTFPRTFSGLLTRLFRQRQMADYEFDLSISEEDAKKDIESSQTILKAIKRYLVEQGFSIE